jgi:hypothetical protein
MSAGLPGLGLSGLFVLLSALGTPIIQLFRTRHRRAGRTRVAPIFALALVMAIAMVGIWEGVVEGVGLLGYHASNRESATASTAYASVPVVLVSLCILVAIVTTAELALHLSGPRTTPTPPPLPFPSDTGQRPPSVAMGNKGAP